MSNIDEANLVSPVASTPWTNVPERETEHTTGSRRQSRQWYKEVVLWQL